MSLLASATTSYPTASCATGTGPLALLGPADDYLTFVAARATSGRSTVTRLRVASSENAVAT